ncbi:MAG: DM13 domain-containing protein [Flavobacteriaceae bacterium]
MKRLVLLFYGCFLAIACIGEDYVDDYVEPNLRITNAILSIREGLSYQFNAFFFDESGRKVASPVLEWSAIPPSAVAIQADGTITALEEGNVTLTVTTVGLKGNTIKSSLSFLIRPNPVTEIATSTMDTSSSTTDTTTSTSDTSTSTTDTSTSTTDTTSSTTDTTSSTTDTSTSTTDTTSSTTDTSTSTTDTTTSTTDTTTTTSETTDEGIETVAQFFEGQIRTTSSYILEGNFRYEHNGTQIILTLDETYRASSSLPGLYLYLTNNPNSPEDGSEVGKVSVFSGAHSYSLPTSIGLMDYKYLLYWCRPFRVKVGDAQLFED